MIAASRFWYNGGMSLRQPIGKMLEFPVHGDRNGSLVALEKGVDFPFEIRRVYYIWGTKADYVRGHHSHRNLEQVVVCTSGSCDFTLDDGARRETYRLDSPTKGLYIRNNVWREFTNFSADCVVMVLASERYNEADYVRDYGEFLKTVGRESPEAPFVHPLSDVQSRSVGAGTRIWQYVVVLPQARIGRDCNICSHCFIENDVVLGDRVTVKPLTAICDGVTIGDGAFVGPSVSFTNDRHPKSGNRAFRLERTRVGAGASIGAGAMICAGVTIGESAMVAAGSVVTRDVPPGVTVCGVPARPMQKTAGA